MSLHGAYVLLELTHVTSQEYLYVQGEGYEHVKIIDMNRKHVMQETVNKRILQIFL
jgi:hypothetical protein